MGDFTCEIYHGRTLEYFDEPHVYLVDGILVPSITSVLKKHFGGRYDGIPAAVLERAAEAGTAVHEAIEQYVKTGRETPLPELRGFRYLQKKHGFEVLDSELPVILFGEDGNPIAAGRLDLVLKKDGQIGGADIKRTSRLDKEYLTAQLNLYRLAYEQSYGEPWTFLAGLHLREDTRKWVDIPIEPGTPLEIINKYFDKEITQ